MSLKYESSEIELRIKRTLIYTTDFFRNLIIEFHVHGNIHIS